MIILMDDLTAYKKSVGIIAAFKLNIFDIILKNNYIDEQICMQYGYNFEYCQLLLRFLTDNKYLNYINDRWQLSQELSSQKDNLVHLEAIIKHENNLVEKWLLPESIVSVIKGSTNHRTFDLQGFSNYERECYDEAVYGKCSKVLALSLYRILIKKSNIKFLEYGRRKGLLLENVKKYCKNIVYSDYIDFNENINMKYDLITCVNTIHYYNEDILIEKFSELYRNLNDTGVLCITDMFYASENIFNSTLLLDWLTHGGIYNITVDSIVNILKRVGFSEIECRYMINISSHMILGKKFSGDKL